MILTPGKLPGERLLSAQTVLHNGAGPSRANQRARGSHVSKCPPWDISLEVETEGRCCAQINDFCSIREMMIHAVLFNNAI